MLYLATVPNAYEIACIVTGDKDFIPALQKTRMLGTQRLFFVFLLNLVVKLVNT